MQMPQVVLSVVGNPKVQCFVLALLSAWVGLFAHLLKKNLDGVKTAKQLRRYMKRHFTTFLLSALIGVGIAAFSMKGFVPGVTDIYVVITAAVMKGYIGDSAMEIPRKSQEQK